MPGNLREHSGRLNALKRHRPADDPEVARAAAQLREARAADYVQKLVDAAPPLSAEMRNRLAVLLLTGPGGDAA